MQITRFGAENALSFERLDCPVGRTLNVITGANAAGKSSLGRILNMVLGALEACYTANWETFSALYGDAGFYDAPRWSIRLGVAFDSDEVAMFDNWVRAGFHTLVQNTASQDHNSFHNLIENATDSGAEAIFGRGEFVLDYDRARPQPWQVSWHSGDHAAGVSPNIIVRLEAGNWLHANGTPDSSPITPIDRLFGAPAQEPEQAHTSAPAAADLPADFQLPTLAKVLEQGGLDLHVAPTRRTPEPASTQRVMAASGVNLFTSNRIIGFAEVAHKLLQRTVGLTANQRLPPERQFGSDHLARETDLVDGRLLALALFQDKNSSRAELRQRFVRTQKLFRQLTSPDLTLEITARPFNDPVRETGETTLLTPVVSNERGDIALHLSGAGRAEAAYLAAVLARDWSCLVLDEPATNLSATAQGQVLQAVRERTRRGLQTLLVTHSANLVPAGTLDEARAIVRLVRSPGVTRVYRPAFSDDEKVSPTRLLHARDALFSAGVLLVEGTTELGLCQVWFDRQPGPTATSANILIMSVDSESAFVSYMRLMDRLGIPWCALVDGPALKNRLHPYRTDAPRDDFDAARTFWREQGVFTVAEEFGTDERKGCGEVEVFLRRVNEKALADAEHEGGKSKPQVGRHFANQVAVPTEFAAIWKEVLERFAIQ